MHEMVLTFALIVDASAFAVAVLAAARRSASPPHARRIALTCAWAGVALALAGVPAIVLVSISAGFCSLTAASALLILTTGFAVASDGPPDEDEPDDGGGGGGGGDPRDPEPPPVDWDAFDRARAGWSPQPVGAA